MNISKQSSGQNIRTGFTLIELLVVIAIISILAGILFPVFARARMNAIRTNSLSNVKQLGISYLMYMQDYDEKTMPRGSHWFEGSMNRFDTTWPYVLQPYLKSEGVLNSLATKTKDDILASTYAGCCMWFYWQQRPDYGYNYLYLGTTWGEATDGSGNPRYGDGTAYGTYNWKAGDVKGHTLAAIQSPSETVLFSSSIYNGGHMANNKLSGNMWVNTPDLWSGVNDFANSGGAEKFGAYGMNSFRYNGLTTTIFVDGHAKAIRVSQLQQRSLWDRE